MWRNRAREREREREVGEGWGLCTEWNHHRNKMGKKEGRTRCYRDKHLGKCT